MPYQSEKQQLFFKMCLNNYNNRLKKNSSQHTILYIHSATHSKGVKGIMCIIP